MFNPQAKAQALHFGDRACVVVDNALAEPLALRALAAKHWPAFEAPKANAFPGPELALPEAGAWAFTEAMLAHAADHLGVSAAQEHVHRVYARLSVVTRAASELDPIQRLCHRDRLNAPPGTRVVAGVLYLFDAPSLGGTNFFEPTDAALADARMAHAARFSHEDLDGQIGGQRGYMCESNAWFRHVGTVDAAFNRLIVYDGSLFHGSAIQDSTLLRPDPERGRLAVNVFAVVTSAQASSSEPPLRPPLAC